MALHQAIELVALLHFDGKLEMKSKFEVDMHEAVVNQIKIHSKMSQRTLALCWVYFQAHSRNGLGQFIKVNSVYSSKYKVYVT